ncbi:glycosyltransferase family 4 protein [Povalibacter sp.]|uniref:glycosyltransferase family 4 protein n=1 Tax=Povalibacter sp. TaxID=1962978 RepID=UPI002F3F2D03
MSTRVAKPAARHSYVSIGGMQQSHGGVEVFMQRLAEMWPHTGLGAMIVLPANSAVCKTSQGLYAGLRRWWHTHLDNVRFIRQATRRAEGQVTSVWYHYGNALDLLSIALLSRLSGIRLIVTPHCSLTWRHLTHRCSRWVAHRILKRVHLLLALSREQVEFFSIRGAPPIARMRTLLPSSTAQRTPFRERPRGSLIFAGRVSPEKGIREMVDLLRILLAEREGFALEIFGEAEPEMHDFLREVAQRDPALAAAIRIHGRVSAQEVMTQLGRHRYLIYLSRVDAFPLAVLEAVIAGALPVVYELPGTAEIIARWGGIMGTPADLPTLARAILDTESETSPPRLKSGQAAQYYSTADVARQLRSILEV